MALSFCQKGGSMTIIIAIITFIFGSAIGFTIAVELKDSINSKRFVGELRIDNSIPEDDPYMFLEIYKGIDLKDIEEQKFVILKVNNKSYISQ